MDLQTDKSNCGGCGLQCITICAAGECSIPLAPNALGSNGALAIEGSNLYYAGLQGLVTIPNSLNGPPTYTVLEQPGQNLVGGTPVAVDAENVYWTDSNLLQVPISGGAQLTLAVNANPTAIATDGSYVYWTDGSNIMKIPSGGGNTTTLVVGTAGKQSFGASLAVDDTNVYYSVGGSLLTVPKDGGTSSTLGVGPVGDGVNGVALDGTSAYWVDDLPSYAAGSFGAVLKVPIGGGSTVTLATDDLLYGGGDYYGSGTYSRIAVDGQNVYWTDMQDVLRVSVAGGTVTTFVSNGDRAGVVVDSTSVYWYGGQGVMKTTPK